MANSHALEELLYEIHEKGLFDKVLEEIKEIRDQKKYIPTFDLYEIAYERVKEKNFKKNS